MLPSHLQSNGFDCRLFNCYDNNNKQLHVLHAEFHLDFIKIFVFSAEINNLWQRKTISLKVRTFGQFYCPWGIFFK